MSYTEPYFCFILEGKVELNLGDEVHILQKGDSIYLDTPIEHTWTNLGETPAVGFSVNAMPMYV